MEERKFVRPWHKEAVKLVLNGISITDAATRLNRARSSLSRFVNSNLFEQVRQSLEHEGANSDVPSISVSSNSKQLEAKRIERVRLAWEAVDEALRSDEVSAAMKAKIAIEVLKGHGELTEKIQHDHKHLGIMLLQGNQTPEEWEEQTELEDVTEDVEATFELVEE